MKKYILLLLTISLLLPLYAQENELAGSGEYAVSGENSQTDEFAAMDESFSEVRTDALEYAGFFDEEQPYDSVENADMEEAVKPKKPFTFVRQYFETGFNIAMGFDNDLIGLTDIFRKKLVLDLDKVEDLVGKDGFNINGESAFSPFFLTIKNIPIKEGKWDFGLFFNTEGNLNINFPQSMFTLISQGNIKSHSFDGMFSASGGLYANAGLSASAKYGNLRLGFKPTLYTPLLFIPKSGIEYYLDTENNLHLTTAGEINVYSPIIDAAQDRGFQLQFGLDLTFDGEYNLFPFLDLGGSLSSVPFVPANMKKRTHLTMKDMDFNIQGSDFLQGKDISDQLPDFGNIEFDQTYDVSPYKVFRPFRFDTYARYKPLNTDLLGIVPNLGFSVDINEKQGYFNGGLEVQLNIKDIFMLHLGTGYQETIWKHRLGFALNFRAFEFSTETMLRSQSFVGSFKAQGLGLNMGIRIGW